MAVNKVIYGNTVIIDITDSTIKSSDLRDGVTAYDKSGKKITGSLDVDVNVTNFTGTVTLISGDDYRLNIS
jgi:hypothetical protein